MTNNSLNYMRVSLSGKHAVDDRIEAESPVVRDMKKLYSAVDLKTLGKSTELELDRLNPKDIKGVVNVKDVFDGCAKLTYFLNSTVSSLIGAAMTREAVADQLKKKNYLAEIEQEILKHTDKVTILEKSEKFKEKEVQSYFDHINSSFVIKQDDKSNYIVQYCLGNLLDHQYKNTAYLDKVRYFGLDAGDRIHSMFANVTPDRFIADAEDHAKFLLDKLNVLAKTTVSSARTRVDIEVPFDFDFTTLFKDSSVEQQIGIEISKFGEKQIKQFSTHWTLVISIKNQHPLTSPYSLANLSGLQLVVLPRLKISRKAAWYLTQAPSIDQIKISTLYLWALNWSQETVSKKKKKNLRLISALSDNFHFSRRKQEVMNVTPLDTRVCPETKLFIDFEGNYRYAPSTSAIDEATILSYEADYEKFVKECADLNEPIDITNTDLNRFAQSNPDPRLKKILDIADGIRAYNACPLISNWDINICASVNYGNPTKLQTVNVQGSIQPSKVALNEVLNTGLRDGMQQILGGLEHNQDNVLFDSQAYIQNNSIGKKLSAVYSYLKQNGKIKDINEYLERASLDIHQKAIDQTFFEYGIYAKHDPRLGVFISNNCAKLGSSHLIDPDLVAEVEGALQQTDGLNAENDCKIEPNLVPFVKDFNRFWMFYKVWSSIFFISQGEDLKAWEMARYAAEKKIDPSIPEFDIHDSKYFLDINSQGTVVKNLAGIIQHYIVGRAFSMICRDLLLYIDNPKNILFSVDPNYPKPVIAGKPQLPDFEDICKQIMPFVSTFGYILTRVKSIGNAALAEQSKFVKNGNELDAVPGGDPHFTYHNHQARGLDTLRNEPRVAILDIAPGGGKCLVGSSLVPTNHGILTLQELWDGHAGEWIDQNFRELNVEVKTLDGVRTTDKIYRSVGKTIKVRFSDGQTVEGLAEHQMYGLHDGKLQFIRLDKLRVGDVLPRATATKMGASTSPHICGLPMSLDLASLLGKSLKLRQHGETADWQDLNFKELCENVFNAEMTREKKIEIEKWLNQFVYDSVSAIRQSPSIFQIAWLSELIFVDKVYTGDSVTVSATKAMLENLGIRATIENKISLKIDPSGYGVVSELLGRPHEDVQKDQLVPGGEFVAEIHNIVNHAGLEFPILDTGSLWISKARCETLIHWLSDQDGLYSATIGLAERARLDRAVESLHLVCEHEWVEVVKIKKKKKEKEVFDLSVPGPHHYVVNNLYGHNTLCVLADCLMLMGQGKVKKPLFIAPQNLIANWVIDLNNVASKEKYNCVIITSKTAAKWGEDKLKDMILGSPPNTIFFTDMHYIGMPHRKITLQFMGLEHTIYGNLEWLKQFNFDYLAIDEVHYLKNAKGERGGSTRSRLFAELTLNPAVKYIRLATGTIINNEIDDIVGQARLFDPSIFKTRKHFMKMYSVVEGKGLAKKEVWSPDAANRVRHRLSKFCAVIRAKRKDWAYALPIPIEQHPSTWFVEMDPDFAKVYDHILRATIEEIKEDPVLSAKLRESGESIDDDEADLFDDDEIEVANSEDEEDTLSGKLKVYLDRIETFLGAPEADKLNGWDGLNFGSLMTPKMPKLIEILDEHFQNDKTGKVIVFVRHIPVVDGILNRLPAHYRKMAVGYHGTIKSNLNDFMFDNKIRIIVGVENSMNTGKNLQIASRIIRMELCWTPGDIDQAIARIFRPDHYGKFNRAVINSDWIVCNNSLEVPKLGRLISKMVEKTKFDEYGNMNYDMLRGLPKLPLNLKKFLTPGVSISKSSQIEEYLEEYHKMVQIQTKEFMEERSKYFDSQGNKTSPSCLPAKVSNELGGAKLITFLPIVSDQNYVRDPEDDGLVPFKQWMCDNQNYINDLSLLKNQDILVYSEFGYGVIYGANTKSGGIPSKVTIITSYGTKQKVPSDSLFVATKTVKDPNVEKAKKFLGFQLKTNKAKYKGRDPRQTVGLLYRENGDYQEYLKKAGIPPKPTNIPAIPVQPVNILTDPRINPAPIISPVKENKRGIVQPSRTQPEQNKVDDTYVPPSSGELSDNKLFASLLLIDDTLVLAFSAKDPDSSELPALNFKRIPAFIGVQLRGVAELDHVLTFIKQSGYNVVDSANKFERLGVRLANKARVLDGKMYVGKESDDLKFLILNHKAPNNPKSIKLSYLVENQKLYLVFNELTHGDAAKHLRGKIIPQVRGKFRRHNSMFVRAFKEKEKAKAVLAKINSVVKIVNYSEIMGEIDSMTKLQAKP